MKAMLLKEPKTSLVFADLPQPVPQDDELLIRVRACGVCRTDLHVQDGDLPHPKFPLILGHEIVGVVEDKGKNVRNFQKGERVGVPWLAGSCGKCEYCQEEHENLCDYGEYAGYTRNGGFAEYAVCRAAYAIPLPPVISDTQIAPLLCAGLVGYRAFRKAAPNKTLGLYGFGASAHIIAQIAVHQGKDVYAFTRDGDKKGQEFAKSLGAVWAGDSSISPPQLLDAAIIFAPVGDLVPLSLKVLKKGGRCVCAGIHMSDIPSFPYKDLWEEKSIQSIANLTRNDSRDFFSMLSTVPIHTEVTIYPLEKAQQALDDLRHGKFHGAAVLQISS